MLLLFVFLTVAATGVVSADGAPAGTACTLALASRHLMRRACRTAGGAGGKANAGSLDDLAGLGGVGVAGGGAGGGGSRWGLSGGRKGEDGASSMQPLCRCDRMAWYTILW